MQQAGLTLLHQNWLQPKVGELDIVMLEKGKTWDVLVFVEVRLRSSTQFGGAEVSITKAKQRKLVHTAQCFLQQHPQFAEHECRFDVVTYNIDNTSNTDIKIDDIEPNWIKNAFIAES